MDTIMEDADLLPEVINLESDDGNDSDSTLLGDEIVSGIVPPVSQVRQNRRRARSPSDSFRKLQSYSQNGRTFKVGRTFQNQDGYFHRVTSIKEHRGSGAVAIESVQDNLRILQTHSNNGRTLRPGKTVQMADGDFLRIKAILEDRRTGEIWLKGFRFQRNMYLEGLQESKVNEVTMMMNYDPNNARAVAEQSTIELAAVVKIRELVMTNHQFPALSFREMGPTGSKEYTRNHCRLICRSKYLCISENEGYLMRLTDVESDGGYSVPQAELRKTFRGRTIKGGTCPALSDEEAAFDRLERRRSRNLDPLRFHGQNPATNESVSRHRERKYTLYDSYSGGGGISRGGHDAGLKIEGGFDQDPDSVATFRLNFPYAKCACISVHDFVMSTNENYKPDILHISPPCQRFSPLHNRPFPNDEQYEATFLATEALVKKMKPRIVTMEETFGLTGTAENLQWFNAMIQLFTKLGFSVRWKVFNVLDFGLPQSRRRLFLFASW